MSLSTLFKVPKGSLIEDFDRLCALPLTKLYKLSLAGNKTINHYSFHHRIKTKVRGKPSLLMAWNNKSLRQKYAKIGRTMSRGTHPLVKLFLNGYRFRVGSITSMKPSFARYVYNLLLPSKPDCTILDPFAGWGGRMLGALSLGLNYRGNDTNTDMIPAYKALASTFNPFGSKVKMSHIDSSKLQIRPFTYDLVFTSPPYHIENYRHMPHYTSLDDFWARLLTPVIKKCYAGLRHSRWLAINVSPSMYPHLKAVMGRPPNKKIRVPLKSWKGRSYGEFVYCWKKA